MADQNSELLAEIITTTTSTRITLHPTTRQTARRIVRAGLADVLDQLPDLEDEEPYADPVAEVYPFAPVVVEWPRTVTR